MKSMIVASMLVASTVAQIYAPAYAGAYGVYGYANGYANAYGYAQADANAYVPGLASAQGAAPRTALDVLNPFYNAYNGYNFGFPGYYNNYYNNFAVAGVAAAPAAVAAAPAAVAAAPIAVEAVPAVKLIESADEVEVVEADASPIVPTGPVEIRRIFPLFQSDLRGAVTDVNFLRPEQVAPIIPSDVDDDVSIVIPEFRSTFQHHPFAFRRF